jgi:Holliday junction resolvase-like predicted endonuclease
LEDLSERGPAIGAAAQILAEYGFDVLARDWKSGWHELDLLGGTGRGALLAVHVRPMMAFSLCREVHDVPTARVREIGSAADIWAKENRFDWDRIQVGAIGFIQMPSGLVRRECIWDLDGSRERRFEEDMQLGSQWGGSLARC